MADFAQAGDEVRFLNANGYDHQLKRAQEMFNPGQILTVASVEIGGWSSTYRFESVPHSWNTVMFEPVNGAPAAESQREQVLPLGPTKESVLANAVETFKTNFHNKVFDNYDEHLRAALEPVVAEVRKAALDALVLDVEAVDGARHLMMWLDGYSRPTDRNLLTHCRLLGKTPPEECIDQDHVSPKSLRTYWIVKAVVDEHRRNCAK
ncbi:hypothetical protein [Shinella zoogloeoides]|uniref:hypothetical protein n=1 Tax=Shinella zoogloeoides TaxID=352475 RepID=UPI00273F06D6|nr:hypothetical protein [Shinella zoogloeoides]WLR90940.1 hypothetical protein Q9316_00760 [Shinella zoogloeoides]